jgi:hypothetical protein
MNGHRAPAATAATLLLLVLLLCPGCGTEKEYAGNLVKTYDKAKATGTAADMKAIGAALSAYRLDHGDYPSVNGIDGLIAELSPDYLRMAARQDKWGNAFDYSAGVTGYRLVSRGEDGREGTEDDLVLEDGRLTATPPGFGPAF